MSIEKDKYGNNRKIWNLLNRELQVFDTVLDLVISLKNMVKLELF